MAADIAGDFAAAGRVADVDRVLQVERFDERREIVGVGVHVVAVPGLARAAVAAAVMGDAAIAAGGQEEHLVLEGVRAQRPAVAEDDGLSAAPVLVIDLRAVFGRDRGHWINSFLCLEGEQGLVCLAISTNVTAARLTAGYGGNGGGQFTGSSPVGLALCW